MVVKKPTEERRREIADAAIKILGERGLREFTAANIAAEVGISDGTVFRHFDDMAGVALAAVTRIRELVGVGTPISDDPVERLHEFVLLRLRAVATQPGIQSLIFSDQISHALGAAGSSQIATIRNGGRGFVKSCLEQAVAKGRVREDLDIEATLLVIMGTMMGVLFAAKDGALPAQIDEVATRCWNLILVVLEPREGAL